MEGREVREEKMVEKERESEVETERKSSSSPSSKNKKIFTTYL